MRLMRLTYEQLETIIKSIIYDTELESIEELLEYLTILGDQYIEVVDECEDYYVNEVMERFKNGEIYVRCYDCEELHRFNAICASSYVKSFKKIPDKLGFICRVESSDYDRPGMVSYQKFMKMWTEEEIKSK